MGWSGKESLDHCIQNSMYHHSFNSFKFRKHQGDFKTTCGPFINFSGAIILIMVLCYLPSFHLKPKLLLFFQTPPPLSHEPKCWSQKPHFVASANTQQMALTYHRFFMFAFRNNSGQSSLLDISTREIERWSLWVS